MNILERNRKGGPYETLKDYMKKSITSTEYELELIYGSHPRNTLTKMEFLKLLQYLRQNYKIHSESNSLDIRIQEVKLVKRDIEKTNFSNIRCTISGVENIKKYCKTNSIIDIPNIEFIEKKSNKDSKNPSLSFNQIKNTDYNFRINLKKEIVLDERDENVIKYKDNLKNALKYYRYKKRFSFLTSDNLYRIDLTSVKSNSYNSKKKTYNLSRNLVDSRILSGKEIYELEIEYVGFNKISGEYPIINYSKKVFSEWDSESMSDEDYKKQLELSSYKSGVSFSPEGSSYYLGDDNSGYEFLSGYESYTYDYESSEINDVDVINEPKPTMNTPWSKAAALKGNPMDNIWLNYWSDRGNWLFFGILDNKKQILFDGVLENYTDKYKGAPKNENYVKYIIYPPFTEDETKSIIEKCKSSNEHEYSSYGKYEKDFNNEFYVPFRYVTGLSELEKYDYLDDDSEYNYESSDEKSGGGKLPSWGPKSYGLSKDNRFIDVVNMKLNEVITNLLVIINNTNLIVSESKCMNILEEYKTLTEQNSKNINFMGPNPVSLSLNELNPNNPHSILSGYVVTEKADGIRAELFIDKESNGYLITQKKEIIYTGLLFKGYTNVILDGEYITKNKDGKEIKLYMIFDIYYLDNGEYPFQPYTLPWIGKKKSDICRSSILSDFKSNCNIKPNKLSSIRDGIYIHNFSKDKYIDDSDLIRIGYKQYYEGPKSLKKDKNDLNKYSNIKGICKVSKKIWDRYLSKDKSYEYNIDGLIYLPMYYPVLSNKEDIVNNNINGTWSQNYKWKPPEENTIDFRVKIIKDEKNKKANKITTMTKNKKIIKCLQVNLYVGYDIKKDLTTDFTEKILFNRDKKLNEILFNPPFEEDSIHICNIPMKDNKCICLKDKTELQDNYIYEMKYEPNNPFGYQWVPLRIRDDKIRPNNSDTADSVWSTIKFPVSVKLITGKEDLNELSFNNDKSKVDLSYYSEDIKSDADLPLRSFHNYMKDKLIKSIYSLNEKSISILDTSIGRGGDIGKYLKTNKKISFLLGLDISPDVNKAAKRFYLENKNDIPSLFIQYDTSKQISNSSGCIGNNIDRNRNLIDIIYAKQKSLPKELRIIVPKYKGLAKKGFDLISSQFTLHYYFRNEETLRGYIQNISENLKKGGHFIGTCYDGMKVYKTLEDLENNCLEMNDEFGNKIYSIKKKYNLDNFNYTKDNKEKLLGQQIDVYMNSIGDEYSEYLVNFELLIDIMKEYDLEFSNSKYKKEFGELFNNEKFKYTDGFGGFDQIINELSNLYTKDKIMKEYYSESINLLKKENILLRKLSELNNWFIFTKK